MEKTIEDLRLEADALGLTYSPQLGMAKLQAKIDEYYENESKAAVVDTVTTGTPAENTVANAKLKAMQVIKEQERANAESVVIKLTMVDKREASTATDAYFNNGDFQMRIPLDIFVEVPKILATIAEEAKALIHKEVNGLTVSSYTKKYVVEYK